MKTNKRTIYSGDWLEFHPYDNTINSDLFYIELCNQVYQAIEKTANEIDNASYLFLSTNEMKQLSCMLTAYFEDILSETQIWNTFTRQMKARYGKWLPYYDTSDYAEEEINEADIEFLCWHFMTQLYEGQTPISPKEPLFEAIAKSVYPLFDSHYETAPENKKLHNFFHIKENDTLFDLQEKFFWLGTESYLFCFNNRDLEKELDDVTEVAKENQMEDQLAEMANMVITDFSFNNVTEFFELTAAKWLAYMIGPENELYESLLNMTEKKSGYFIFQEQDSMYAQFKHVATGEVLHVTNRSLVGFPKDLKSGDVVVYAGFVEWQGEWWFIGDLRGYQIDDELIQEICSREEEINLFKEPEVKVPSDKEQERKANQLLDNLREVNSKEDEIDINWALMYEEEITSDYLRRAIAADAFANLQFPGEEGRELMRADFPFTLSYLRRS